MDFLNKAWAQLTELFRSMTPGARITAVLLLAVVVVSLGYLFKYQTAGPNAYLLGGQYFSPSEINAMMAAFAKANLDGYEAEGSRFRIPRYQQAKYVAALVDGNALPNKPFGPTDQADKDSSPFESREQREHRNQVARQKELSLIVSSMQGIESAVVLYDTDVKPGLIKEKITRAVVSVKPRGSEVLKEEQMLAIRRLVAGAFADLPPERVTVSDLNNGKTFYGNPDGQAMAFDDPYGSRKRMYEQQWTSKILEALNYIPGVNVGVNVELDKSRDIHEESITHEAKTVLPYQTSEKTTTRTMDGSAPAGRPGPLAQSANQPTVLGGQRAKGSHEEEEKSEQQTVNAVPAKRTEKKTAGLTPQRVNVTVGIPASYFKKVWLEQNPSEPGAEPKTPDPKDLDKIRTQVLASATKQVANLLPKPEGVSDVAELVTVNEFQDITPTALPQPSTKEKALSWLAQSWSTVGLILLGLVSLLVLRSVVRSVPTLEQVSASASAPTSGPPAHPPRGDIRGVQADRSRSRESFETVPQARARRCATSCRNWCRRTPTRPPRARAWIEM